MKNYKEASKEYEKIFEIYKEIFGMEHNEMAILLFNMSFAAEGN